MSILIGILFLFQSVFQLPQPEIVRSNGLNFEKIKTKEYPVSLFQDSRKLIWIGTVYGASVYDGYTIENYTYNLTDSLGFKDSFVPSFTEDQFGRIWPATYEGGINLIENGKAELDDCCTPKTQTSSFIDKTFIHNEVTREYSIFIPASYSTDKDWPLVINFHGYTGDIADQVDRTKMNDLADSLDFLIAYPQGININRSSGILPGFVPLSGRGWSVPGFSDERNEIAFVDSLINHIKKEYSIDGERVHTTGASLGGFMALYAATQMPGKIASFASVIGHMTDDVLDLFDENTQTSALLVHGTNDIITSYNGLSGYYKSVPETASIFADRNNCSMNSTESSLTDINSGDNTTVTLIEYSQCDDDREVKLYRVNNGGHRWPGSGRTEPEIIGNNSLDLNATQVILDFFISNPKVAVNNEQEIPTPKNFLLFQNYPNPFNPTTNISFELPGSSLVQLKVYNLLGQEVATLVDGRMNSGTHQLRFDASHLSSGVYVYRLTTESQSITKKMLLIK